MNTYTHLTMRCTSNPGLNGDWTAEAVHEDMDKLGMAPFGNDWIEFVIGHFDFPAAVDDAVTNDDIMTLAFRFEGNEVTISKN